MKWIKWRMFLLKQWYADRLPAWIAYNLVSRKLAYWCFIRVCTSNGDFGPYELNPADRTCLDAMQKWKMK